jgi:hypothetical protein
MDENLAALDAALDELNAVISGNKSAPVREMKAIPLNDWNRALDALREGIASHDYQTAAACMKTALRLLNPCPF